MIIKENPGLTQERWFQFSLMEQLANIGTDISRAIRWRNLGKKEISNGVLDRALELIALTITDPKNRLPRLKEICRMREVLLDYFYGENKYNSTDEFFENYFLYFNHIAAVERGR